MPRERVTKAMLFDEHSNARRPLSHARSLIIHNQEGEALQAVRESLKHTQRLETLLEERISSLYKPPVPTLLVNRRRDSRRPASQRRRERST